MKRTLEFYGGYQVQSESGVDLTLLKENLRLTPTERWVRHSHAADWLRACGREVMLDAARVLRALADHEVRYVVIGGLAMITHGSAHITHDLDICYGRTDANISALAEALAPLRPHLRDAPPELPFVLDARAIQLGMNFTLSTELGPLDLFGEVPGLGNYEAVLAQSEARTLFGIPTRVLSLDALIATKKTAGRVKDQLHLLELEELRKLRDAARDEPPAG